MADVTINLGNLGNIEAICNEAIAKGLNKATTVLQGVMRENFGTSGGGVSGHLAYRYNKLADGSFVTNARGTRKRHKSKKATFTSSPPGGFPGIRTGRLRQSIDFVPATPSSLFTVCGTNLDYGKYLEYGYIGKARDGTTFRVPSRPWCLRSFQMAKEEMLATLKITVAEILESRLSIKGNGI